MAEGKEEIKGLSLFDTSPYDHLMCSVYLLYPRLTYTLPCSNTSILQDLVWVGKPGDPN
jgi:hypothetical protein